jgi:hypothetical protein
MEGVPALSGDSTALVWPDASTVNAVAIPAVVSAVVEPDVYGGGARNKAEESWRELHIEKMMKRGLGDDCVQRELVVGECEMLRKRAFHGETWTCSYT